MGKQLISGQGGGGKGRGGGSSRTAQEVPNSLHSIQHARVLDLVSEGEIEGLIDGEHSVYLDGTPIKNLDETLNFSGVTIHSNTGTQDQDVIAGFDSTESEKRVNLEIRNDMSPIVRSIIDTNVTRARVTIAIPRLTSQNRENGDINGTSVSYKIDYSRDNGTFFPAKLFRTEIRTDFVNNQETNNVRTRSSAAVDGFMLSVQWNRPVVNTIRSYQPPANPFQGGGGRTIITNIYGGTVKKFTLEYRAAGSNSWILHDTYTIHRPTSNTIATPRVSINVAGLPEDIYTIRLISTPDTEDDGTLSFADIDFQGYTGEVNITGKTNRRYLKSVEFPLEGTIVSSWTIRVTRLTDDSEDSALVNAIFWDSYTEIIDNKFNYPNSALVGISIDSSQFNSIPNRGYDIRGLKVNIPTNYDPDTKTYSGLWDGTFQVAWTDNPAWCLYDLIINDRYGLGKYISISDIDKWTFYELGTYCDELVPDGLGQTEPRFTFNTQLQTREEAITVLQNLSSVFRGMLYWANNSIVPVYDHPQEPIAAFTNSNVIEGQFLYTGSSLKARHNVALVTWNDPDDLYRPKVEYVELQQEVATRGIISKEITALGTTSRGQAHRLGKWLLFTEKNETEICTFKSSLEFHAIQPGSVIQVFDKNRAGIRYGGRILDATSSSITIDAPISIQNGRTYSVNIVVPEKRETTRPDGTIIEHNTPKIETRTLNNNFNSSETVLTWSDPLDTIPKKYATFGVNVVDVLESQLFRVISITEAEESGLYEVSCSEYIESKFANIEEGIDLSIRQTSLSNIVPVTPQDVQITEELYTDSIDLKIKLIIDWEVDQFNETYHYNVELKYGNDNYKIVGTDINGNSLELLDVIPGIYTARVYARNTLGRTSVPITSAETEILGKTARPRDVENFTITKRPADLLFRWDRNTELDFSHFEIRTGNSWESGDVIVQDFRGTMHVTDETEEGLYYYYIKAFDTSGNESQNATTISLTLRAPEEVQGFIAAQLNDRIEFVWDQNSENDLIGYEIREGSTWETAISRGIVDVNYFNLPSGTTAERIFLIKSIVKPGIYSTGTTLVSTNVALPPNKNILVTKDEAAANFPGIIHFGNVTDGTLENRNLQNYSEYLFDVDLLENYYAQNTLYAEHSSIRNDDETWSNANYSWNNPSALRLWRIEGNIELVDVEYEFSKKMELSDSNLYSWTFDENLISENGINPSTQNNILFSNGRYNGGILISDQLSLEYTSVNIPQQFNIAFWYMPESLENVRILRLENTSTGRRLTLRYNNNVLELRDNFNIIVSLPMTLNIGSVLLIGVIQTGTQRKIYIGNLEDNSIQTEVRNLTPIGTWNKLQLH